MTSQNQVEASFAVLSELATSLTLKDTLAIKLSQLIPLRFFGELNEGEKKLESLFRQLP